MPEDSPRSSVIRVLVVDDDVAVAMFLGMALPDVEVIEASRAAEGLRIARDQSPGAVIVDALLPDGDGLDLIRSLRAQPGTEAVPILLATTGESPNRRLLLGAGADGHVAKPFDSDAVEAQLRTLLALDPDARAKRRQQGARGRPLRAEGAPVARPAPATPPADAPDEAPSTRRRRRRNGT